MRKSYGIYPWVYPITRAQLIPFLSAFWFIGLSDVGTIVIKETVGSLYERNLFMGKHLNPLEKELLISRFRSRSDNDIYTFCEVNSISVTALKNWMKKYDEQGIEGLITRKKGDEVQMILPEGIDPTNENLKREIMKLRIENERLKKTYTVQQSENGESRFVRLRKKNSKS